MGMSNSAQAFQRLIDSVVGDIPGCFAYLDDLLLYTKDQQSHLELLDTVFRKLSEAGLSLALSKCEFGKDSLEYLGYTINADGLAPLPRKVEALKKFPAPTKQKELLAYLGALNYYRSSLPKLQPEESADKTHVAARTPATVLDPLYKLATCQLQKKKDEFIKIWNSITEIIYMFYVCIELTNI